MREKYIEERYPALMVFGLHAVNGMPQVCDVNGETNVSVLSRAEADRLVEFHNKKVHALINMAQAFEKADQKAFQKFWYEKEDV